MSLPMFVHVIWKRKLGKYTHCQRPHLCIHVWSMSLRMNSSLKHRFAANEHFGRVYYVKEICVGNSGPGGGVHRVGEKWVELFGNILLVGRGVREDD